MRRWMMASIAGAALGLVGAPTSVAAEAPAAGPTAALCTAQATMTFSPGTRQVGGAGTNAGENGTISCVGIVNGHRPTGPGQLSFTDVYGASPGGQSCAFDIGFGTQTYTIPTDAGPVRISEPFTFYGAPVGGFLAPVFSGTFQVVPSDGSTCVSSPVRRSVILMQGFLMRP